MIFEKLAADVARRLAVVEEIWKARLEIDMAGMVRGARARLEEHLSLTPLPLDPDLAEKHGPFGVGRIATHAWQAPGFRKVVLSEISLEPPRIPMIDNFALPLINGFAIVLAPEMTVKAPLFACDFMALPTRISVNADDYASSDLRSQFAVGFGPRDDAPHSGGVASALESDQGPSWLRALASGHGLHAKVSLREVGDAFAALMVHLGAYLEASRGAAKGVDGARSQQIFFEAFHVHGPRVGPLAQVFGKPWAERYSRILFE